MQRHSVTSLETARSLANDPKGGEGGGARGRISRELQRILSLFCLWEESVGGA